MSRQPPPVDPEPAASEDATTENDSQNENDSQYESDGESMVDSEYPENDIRMLADALITSNGEAIADVMAGIRDALEKLTKVLYTTRK
jgi:hypothetical protein